MAAKTANGQTAQASPDPQTNGAKAPKNKAPKPAPLATLVPQAASASLSPASIGAALLAEFLVQGLKPLVHYGVVAAEPAVVPALDQARPYFQSATTPEDRAAIRRILDHLFGEQAA